jgi:hypothetical protein
MYVYMLAGPASTLSKRFGFFHVFSLLNVHKHMLRCLCVCNVCIYDCSSDNHAFEAFDFLHVFALFVCMCMHTRAHIIHTYIQIYIYIYICIYIYIYIPINIHVFAYWPENHALGETRIRGGTHTHIHVHTYIHTLAAH